jgi:L-ascorbate metabolism protein UlaG (beta-lactamase superfamily)
MSSNASPISFLKVKRFSINTLDIIDQLPQIDLLLLSHDHYDHLDFESIKRLNGKVDKYWVSLGVKRHLLKWGICDQKVLEFDWWETKILENIEITFTPSRHSGGRCLGSQDKTLWGGWVIKSKNESVFFSGDGGYGDHFKTIGDKLGPFDFGFMECGQYNKLWSQIHMFPNETVQAAKDTKVKQVIPVHWAGFSLALHKWKDPINEFTKEANKSGISWKVPNLGEITNSLSSSKRERWWDNLD